MENNSPSSNPSQDTPSPVPTPSASSSTSSVSLSAAMRSVPDADLSSLQAQVESLRKLVGSLLIFTILVSGTLNIYFWRQYRISKSDLEVIRPQATAMISNYTTNNGPAMDDLVKRIQEYGRTHADFAPIVAKYQLNQAPTGAPPAKAAAPVVPPAAQKK